MQKLTKIFQLPAIVAADRKSLSKHPLIGCNFFCKLALCTAITIMFSVFAHCSDHADGVSTSPTIVFSIGKFPVTDSLILSWLVSLVIICMVRFILRGGVHMIPSTGQAILESIIDGLSRMIKPIVGNKAFKCVFPFVISYFFFIFFQNLSGLFPGIGSIGVHVNGAFRPLFRPAGADLNTTLALAIVAFFAWLYFCIKYVGAGGLAFEIFGNKASKDEVPKIMYLFLFFLFFAVGLIECVSILCRIISLSCRLFGNTFGGENLLHNMYGFPSLLKHVPVIKYLSYLIPLPFYFLEFLVAIIQAFVFTLLVSVYTGFVCNHGHDDHEEFLQEERYVASNS